MSGINMRFIGDVWQDVRYATRTFWKQPAFAAATVLTLALGIGATTAIFSVVYGVLLKPLPFDQPEGLVSVSHHAPRGAGANHGPATYLTYRENQTAFEAIGAWDPAAVSITGSDNPERVPALLLSAATLPLLRVQPVLGQFFSATDDLPGSPLRVVLAHGYWLRRFGGATTIIGQSLVIDGRPREVIGVLPSSFKFLRTRPDVLLPLPLDPAAPRGISFRLLNRSLKSVPFTGAWQQRRQVIYPRRRCPSAVVVCLFMPAHRPPQWWRCSPCS